MVTSHLPPPTFAGSYGGLLRSKEKKEKKKKIELCAHKYNITLLPSVSTLIARGMFCGAKYTHHTFTPIIKHLITTANKHPGKKSFIDKNMRKSHWHQAVHIT